MLWDDLPPHYRGVDCMPVNSSIGGDKCQTEVMLII